MLDEDIGEASIGRSRHQEILEGLEPSGRGAKTNHRARRGMCADMRFVWRKGCILSIDLFNAFLRH